MTGNSSRCLVAKGSVKRHESHPGGFATGVLFVGKLTSGEKFSSLRMKAGDREKCPEFLSEYRSADRLRKYTENEFKFKKNKT